MNKIELNSKRQKIYINGGWKYIDEIKKVTNEIQKKTLYETIKDRYVEVKALM